MHFSQELEEKQVRRCQAAWQLNPHRGYVLSSCWRTAQTPSSTERLIQHARYFSNSITAGETYSRKHNGTMVQINSFARKFLHALWLRGDPQDKCSFPT